MKLPISFYTRDDVVLIAKELLGKYLFTRVDGKLTGGIITETEAYEGITDRASHAFGGRRTTRTEIMYREGGTAYVYLCYGIHSLVNVVTNKKDIPHAVLIRAIRPTHGIDEMLKRRQMNGPKKNLSAGPGTLSTALGIHYSDSGKSLLGKEIWIEDKGIVTKPASIKAGTRIGVDYAGEDAERLYRFVLNL
ncbi:MAG: DNA-3-methyladenine glycosylase [Bacteroidetes bacterium]|nr:DNA-3-methyladenine glycosylase [Bacteroidota bacterium]